MLWSYISVWGVVDINKVDGITNTKKYGQILKPPGFIFEHDDDPFASPEPGLTQQLDSTLFK